MLSKLLQDTLDVFLNENYGKTNQTSKSHKLLVVDLPKTLTKILARPDLFIKGTEGIGNRTDYPWVCIMNRKLTTTPQQSIYIAILFKKDMTGFYLTLNQGIKYFEGNFKKLKYEKAEKVAAYFKQEIQDGNFSKSPIFLGGKRGDKGYGYEKTTILQKQYNSNQFNDFELIKDLNEMLKLYDEVVDLMYPKTYEQAVENILDSPSEVKIAFEQASKQIEEVLRESDSQSKYVKDLIEVEPNRNKVKRLSKLTQLSDKKTDYIEKAKESARTGLVGEELVLHWEKNKLLSLGYDNLVEEIKWVSKQTDVYGYDIESFHVADSGEIEKIYIEVKTTLSKYDTDFFVSSNEVEKSKKLNKNYWLYRVFDCDSYSPKMYKINGSIPENFEIDPFSYIARLKRP